MTLTHIDHNGRTWARAFIIMHSGCITMRCVTMHNVPVVGPLCALVHVCQRLTGDRACQPWLRVIDIMLHCSADRRRTPPLKARRPRRCGGSLTRTAVRCFYPPRFDKPGLRSRFSQFFAIRGYYGTSLKDRVVERRL